MAHTPLPLLLVMLLLTAACDGPPLDGLDGGDGRPPSFLPPIRDSGVPPVTDAGPQDAGPTSDAGPQDSGPAPDGGPLPTDAGSDAGPEDAGAVDVVLVSPEGGPCYEPGGAVCEQDLVCAPYYVSGAGTCARACDVEGQACTGGGACTDFGTSAEPFLICATEVADGEGCDPEQLIVCGGGGVCLANDDDPLGGTCRTPCTCQTGTSCSTSACTASVCVVVNLQTSAGYCGATAQPGEACDPIAGGLFCEGDATCLIDELGAGTCRARCDAPGTTDPSCTSLPDHACFGDVDDGFCLPTTNLGQNEVCTDGTTTPAIPLTCAPGFGCIHLADHAVGYGLCLEDCAGTGDAACETGRCYGIESIAAGGGDRCLTELPRGMRGCDYPTTRCEGEAPVCVALNDDESICKQRCTVASCPGGACECQGTESCITTFLASTDTGVCGTERARNEPCDEDLDLYCAPAPGEDIEGNAVGLCLAERCQYLCRYPGATAGTFVDLACPGGMECRPDPTGRLLDTVQVCVDVD